MCHETKTFSFFFFCFFLFEFKKEGPDQGTTGWRWPSDLWGHGFSSFPFPLFHDKSELVPTFSFSLVILCLIKTYIPSWFLGKIGQYIVAYQILFSLRSTNARSMSICKLCISLNSLWNTIQCQTDALPASRNGDMITHGISLKKKWRNLKKEKRTRKSFVWSFYSNSLPQKKKQQARPRSAYFLLAGALSLFLGPNFGCPICEPDRCTFNTRDIALRAFWSGWPLPFSSPWMTVGMVLHLAASSFCVIL